MIITTTKMAKKDVNKLSDSRMLFLGWMVFISLLVIIPAVVYESVQGRWECVEYQHSEITTCDYEVGDIESAPCKVEAKDECIKEVWTRHVN